MATTYYYVHGPLGAGLKDGSSPENAWDKIASFLAINPTADQECLCRGSETLAAIPACASDGTGRTNAKHPRIYGCGADWVAGSAQYTIAANGQNAGLNVASRNYWEIGYLTISGMALDGIQNLGESGTVHHCKISSPPRYGISSSEAYTVVSNNIIVSPTNIGIASSSSQGVILFNLVTNGTIAGIYSPNGECIIGNGVIACGDDCIQAQYGCYIAFNVLHGSTGGSGFKATSFGRTQMIIGNSITNNNQYGIEGLSSEMAYEDFNGFRGNGVADRLNCMTGKNSFSFAADPYVDAAGGNYTRKDSSQTAKNSIAVALDWDQAVPKNYVFVPAGVIPGDLAGSGGGGTKSRMGEILGIKRGIF